MGHDHVDNIRLDLFGRLSYSDEVQFEAVGYPSIGFLSYKDLEGKLFFSRHDFPRGALRCDLLY
jgi:hypothetical protein